MSDEHRDDEAGEDVNPRGFVSIPQAIGLPSSMTSPAGGPPAQLETKGAAAPEPEEPFGMLDLKEPPEQYHVDECHIMPRDPFTLLVWWEVTPRAWEQARAALGADGRLIARVYSVAADPHGGAIKETVDHELSWDHGRRYVPAPRAGAHVSAAIGLRDAEGRFAPMCHAPRVRVPQAEPGVEGAVEWMEVAPVKSRGLRIERPEIIRRGSGRAMLGAGGVGSAGRRAPGWRDGFWEQDLPGALGSSRAGRRAGGPPADLPSSPWRWPSSSPSSPPATGGAKKGEDDGR